MARRNALGRGLGALIPDDAAARRAANQTTATRAPTDPTEPGSEAPAPSVNRGGPQEIEVGRIDPNPEQPRRVFAPEEIARLAESIERHGVIQPVVVRRAGERFELVVGERRWRASQAAGRETIPAVVADLAEGDRLEVALVENVQRQDLNPIELALAFRALAEAGATQEQIGSRVGLDRSSVANHLRLLELSREHQTDVENGRLSLGHAKALLQVSNPERRRHLRDRVVAGGLSVRQAEELARDAGGSAKRAGKPAAAAERLDPNVRRIIDLLRDRLKTRVHIQGGAARGRIEIEYFGVEDLNRIVHAILDAR
jgi:ParB family chromosome partitioning protein